MSLDSVCRFRCSVCGRLTAGKVPNSDGRYAADKSERYPRMHRRPFGEPCPGVYEFAEWVEVSLATGEPVA